MTEGYLYKKMAEPSVTAVEGFKAAGVSCGIKKKGSRDLALLCSDRPAVAAGVFTRNLVQAAPVHLCRKQIDNPIRAVVINSGNANACTGEAGMQNAAAMASEAAGRLGLSHGEVLVCSTGVIGEQLPMERVKEGINKACSVLSGEPAAGREAAEAILTTDTAPKETAYRVELPTGPFHLAGMAKGSGMICPNMATMLAFLATDVKIERGLLRRLFRKAVDRSFNLITVDGDTSTNDTALILANGAAAGAEIIEGTEGCELFYEVLEKACRDLACSIVHDGEGVTKVITLTVQGAPDQASAGILARSVLNSPLVKTAFYGEDANWGRIIAALGCAGVDFDPAMVDIYIGPVQVAARGGALLFSETEAKAVLRQREIPVLIDLHAGPGAVTAWGTDLSHEYISINSNYRS